MDAVPGSPQDHRRLTPQANDSADPPPDVSPDGSTPPKEILVAIKDIFIAKGHTEPLGQLDRWDGRTDAPAEDFNGDSRAEVSTPKQAKR